MNVLKAREILGLPEKWNESELKKKYHTLAKMYHPDKNKTEDSKHFLLIQQAYEFLSKPQPQPQAQINVDDIFNNLFNSFNSFNSFKFPNFSKIKEITISPKEYFTGTVKNIKVPVNCKCSEAICSSCAGCGFNNILLMDTCMECLGNGCIKTCACPRDSNVKIVVQPFATISGHFNIKLDDPRYIFMNGKIYHRFDITLKESLVGFSKTFKDPFGTDHTISIKKSIIKQNDGYNITLSEVKYDLTLLFNVIYPKCIKKSTKKILEDLDF
jgi:DnaJ-class molecular chaperone